MSLSCSLTTMKHALRKLQVFPMPSLFWCILITTPTDALTASTGQKTALFKAIPYIRQCVESGEHIVWLQGLVCDRAPQSRESHLFLVFGHLSDGLITHSERTNSISWFSHARDFGSVGWGSEWPGILLGSDRLIRCSGIVFQTRWPSHLHLKSVRPLTSLSGNWM